MTPKEAATKLVDAGFAQPQIVAMLSKQGVTTTQATISRIITGDVENPMFEVGAGLVALCEAKTKKTKKSVA